MLSSHSPSPSPNLRSSYSSSSGNGNGSSSSARFLPQPYSPRQQLHRRPSSSSSSSTSAARSSRHPSVTSPRFTTVRHPPHPSASFRPRPPPTTADASTQYSPPNPVAAVPLQAAIPPPQPRAMTVTPLVSAAYPPRNPSAPPKKREVDSTSPEPSSPAIVIAVPPIIATPPTAAPSSPNTTSKRPRLPPPKIRYLPSRYEECPVTDLVTLISSMLMELIHLNDDIPLQDGRLTRFHSRAPPTISVSDYLLRLTTHATLSPPLLLSMVYYIDRLYSLYPQFIISSLTVHRFLIVSATVASKGLSDSFWTNSTYARVGGVSLHELALLELDFLEKVDWRIVPWGDVLEEYYASLVERADGFEILRKVETQQDVQHEENQAGGEDK